MLEPLTGDTMRHADGAPIEDARNYIRQALGALMEVADNAERARKENWNEAIEAAAQLAGRGMLVPPDGGSPTPDEIRVAEDIAAGIRKLKYRSC